jgi:heme A synthase
MKMPTNGVAKDIRHYVGSLIVFFLVIIILYYLTKYTIPEQNSQIVNTLIGMIAASIAMVIASITGRNPDDLEAAKKKISNLEMKIEMLVQAKDTLENMLIKIQDDTIDRLLLNKAIDCDGKKCNCKKNES